MKNLFNNLSEEEKKAILEQHYGEKELVNEQLRGLGSQLGARVKQAAQTVGTVGQRVGAAVTGKQELGKSAGLEGKRTYAMSVAKTLYNNLLSTSADLKKNKADANKMGDYKDEAENFNKQIDAITSFLDDMSSQFNSKMAGLNINYQTGGQKASPAPAAQPEPQTKTPNPDAETGIA
jgi:hypothetical protein